MNIIKSNEQIHIYNSSVELFNEIPIGTYKVCFSKMTGFFLTTYNDLQVDEKMYGIMLSKVDKVFNTFSQLNRNFGILLSGQKGSGKTMFAKKICEQSIEKYKMPVIIIDQYFPNITSFIDKIEQQVLILFDEFDKTYAISDEDNPQNELLSLFDGVSSGKKFFIITCNDTKLLSDFLINRPGRFHYHFKLGSISEEAIEEYLKDNLNKEHFNLIKDIIGLNNIMDMSYDYLRAIVFDLNNGYSLKETVEDLNISIEERGYFNFIVTLNNGIKLKTKIPVYFDLRDAGVDHAYLYFEQNNIKYKDIRLTLFFCPNSIAIKNGKFYINPKDIDSMEWDLISYGKDTEENQKIIKTLEQKAEISDITIEKIPKSYSINAF